MPNKRCYVHNEQKSTYFPLKPKMWDIDMSPIDIIDYSTLQNLEPYDIDHQPKKIANFDNKYLFISFDEDLYCRQFGLYEPGNMFLYNNQIYRIIAWRDNKLLSVDHWVNNIERYTIPQYVLEFSCIDDIMIHLKKDDILIIVSDDYIFQEGFENIDFMSSLSTLIETFRSMDNNCINETYNIEDYPSRCYTGCRF